MDVVISTENFARLLKSKSVFTPRYPFKFKVGGFAKKSFGRDAGLLEGDEIVGVNGVRLQYFDEFIKARNDNKGGKFVLNIDRAGTLMDITVQVDENGIIGLDNSYKFDDVFEYKVVSYGFLASFPAGIKRGFETTNDYLKQFKLFFKPETKAYESLGGFITIGSIFPGVWDWNAFWNMTAFISIILAIMNLLPIPALDGGHVLFLFYEIITGRKPNDKFLEYAQIAGMIFLLALLLFANANDIIKLFR